MASFRFDMMIARSSQGERGWQLAEVVNGEPFFRFWSKSYLECRQHAVKLGATDTNLMIEGRLAKDFRMPEGCYRLSREEMRRLGYKAV